MPYIKVPQREVIDPAVKALGDAIVASEAGWGGLNYAITTLLMRIPHHNYESQASLLGCLEAVKLEMYRRGVAKYEDKKARENGDLPGFIGWN